MKKNMKLLVVNLVDPEKSTFVKPENLSLFIKEKSCSNFIFIAVDERIEGTPGKRIQIKLTAPKPEGVRFPIHRIEPIRQTPE